jgi:hypothetical protein
MRFQITALPPAPFAPLFALPEDQLAARLACRVVATSKPGFPCRVSLQDADIGEELMLVNYRHQHAASPFQASHAIYVRKAAEQAHPEVNAVPATLLSRTLSLRAFDACGMMCAADIVPGAEAKQGIGRLLGLTETAYVHIHFAAFGCYAARAERAP